MTGRTGDGAESFASESGNKMSDKFFIEVLQVLEKYWMDGSGEGWLFILDISEALNTGRDDTAEIYAVLRQAEDLGLVDCRDTRDLGKDTFRITPQGLAFLNPDKDVFAPFRPAVTSRSMVQARDEVCGKPAAGGDDPAGGANLNIMFECFRAALEEAAYSVSSPDAALRQSFVKDLNVLFRHPLAPAVVGEALRRFFGV